jgi:hypothetical protein
MKKSLLTVLLGLGVVTGFSQHYYTPPTSVSQSFQKEYPKSKATQWSKSAAGWSVSFKDKDHNNGEATAYFNASGRHIETHIPYSRHDVPAPVKKHVEQRYGSSGDYDYTRIDHYSGKTVYRTQVKHKNVNKNIYMDNDGHEKDYHEKYY